MVDKNTFGKGACFENLASILNEKNDKKMVKNISNIIMFFSSFCNKNLRFVISDKNSIKTFKKSLIIVFKDCLQQIDNLKLPKLVDTHSRCCLNAIYKNNLKRLDFDPNLGVPEQFEISLWLRKDKDIHSVKRVFPINEISLVNSGGKDFLERNFSLMLEDLEKKLHFLNL